MSLHSPFPAPHAPFVPMPHRMVAGMLRLAGVKSSDLLYDLGCGDGRVVIAAAREHGCRGVGIDSNPRRIRECEEHAEQAGVADRVRFLHADLWKADISAATVVTLYLLSLINVQLRPRLFGELRPGSRVVSYEFGMGAWKPDSQREIEGYPMYCWIIPAQAAGIWECTVGMSGVQERSTLQLEQQFQEVFGALRSNRVTVPITGCVLRGNRLQLTVHDTQTLFASPMRFSGRVEGNRFRGVMAPVEALHQKVPVSAQRVR